MTPTRSTVGSPRRSDDRAARPTLRRADPVFGLSARAALEARIARETEAQLAPVLEAHGEAHGEARDLPVSDEVRTQIVTCTDLATLDRWIARAATARTADEVVAAP